MDEMTAHEVARQLLAGEDFPLTASLDISTSDENSGRRLFSYECLGVNDSRGPAGEIVLMFAAHPTDNEGKAL